MTATTAQPDFQKAHRQAKNRESFLETLESIVVAFVLAFVFRAFVVEAFVIPTGSMGPTLYGAHYELKCPDCGYAFAVGADQKLDYMPLCPNCFRELREVYEAHSDDKNPDFSGDRILVLKFIYDFQEPQRWDVIVFRNPNDPSQNFIKRLVGLPGESIQVVDGNVWINDRIATKTDKAQEALWQIVHDTRHRPTRPDWQPRWIADSPWDAQDSGFVLAKPPEGAKPSWLTYRHRDESGRLANIRDFCSYNVGGSQAANLVTDLSLKAVVTAAQAQSVVVVELRAWKDRFRFELTAEGGDQPTRILMNDQVLSQLTGGGVLPVGKAVEIEAANVDHKLMLLVGGRRVAITRRPASPEGDPTYEPTPMESGERYHFENPPSESPSAMAAEVRLGVRGGPVTVAWLRLDRDVYYTTNDLHRSDGVPPAAVYEPYGLEPDEFFVMGDNSPRSFDARVWPLDRSAVPRKNLVGKAFFIYWPAAGSRYHIPLRVVPDATGFRLVH